MRKCKLTTHDDGGMTPWAAMVAWEGYERLADIEMRGLLGFARGHGLDEATVREIYNTVGREA